MTEVLCCWCDQPATRNLDRYYDVCCDEHHAQWFAHEEA